MQLSYGSTCKGSIQQTVNRKQQPENYKRLLVQAAVCCLLSTVCFTIDT
jgi:hypothetical protein